MMILNWNGKHTDGKSAGHGHTRSTFLSAQNLRPPTQEGQFDSLKPVEVSPRKLERWTREGSMVIDGDWTWLVVLVDVKVALVFFAEIEKVWRLRGEVCEVRVLAVFCVLLVGWPYILFFTGCRCTEEGAPQCKGPKPNHHGWRASDFLLCGIQAFDFRVVERTNRLQSHKHCHTHWPQLKEWKIVATRRN